MKNEISAAGDLIQIIGQSRQNALKKVNEDLVKTKGKKEEKCYKEFVSLGNFGDDSGSAPAVKKGGNPISVILGWILPADNQTLQLLGVIGNTAFYFLPVLVAYSAGRKFGADPVLVTAVAAIEAMRIFFESNL